ncbi:UPF0746 protein DDB_G0281095-like [Nasonia vitripennis]|uniref:Uncharacterized protein n=1 Tax=Nasonia vitripennis TaxID=7425 RepID=A0A7M7Q3G8_NASVI|nr:UPF0746 protein DDB_G0281095-like [Nasonia vitripennis]
MSKKSLGKPPVEFDIERIERINDLMFLEHIWKVEKYVTQCPKSTEKPRISAASDWEEFEKDFDISNHLLGMSKEEVQNYCNDLEVYLYEEHEQQQEHVQLQQHQNTEQLQQEEEQQQQEEELQKQEEEQQQQEEETSEAHIDLIKFLQDTAIFFSRKMKSILLTNTNDKTFKSNVTQPLLGDIEENIQININKFNPMRTGSSYIPLPTFIEKRKACLNVKNFENKCFIWAILSALHPANHNNHPNRLSNYILYEYTLNMRGIELPVS